MQMSESREPATSQHPTCGSNQKVLTLSHPIGRIISQSQSWLLLPRPNKRSTLEFIHVNQTQQMSGLIETV